MICDDYFNRRYTNIIKKDYWIYINKGGNIVESGIYADNNKKFGTLPAYETKVITEKLRNINIYLYIRKFIYFINKKCTQTQKMKK